MLKPLHMFCRVMLYKKWHSIWRLITTSKRLFKNHFKAPQQTLPAGNVHSFYPRIINPGSSIALGLTRTHICTANLNLRTNMYRCVCSYIHPSGSGGRLSGVKNPREQPGNWCRLPMQLRSWLSLMSTCENPTRPHIGLQHVEETTEQTAGGTDKEGVSL